MDLQKRITTDITEAMKNREALRLETLRSVKTAITNELVATSRTPQDNLTDDEVLAVIKRLHKQRLEAAEQFKNAGRDDLHQKEISESEILAKYLPTQLTDEELDKLVSETIAEMGDVDKSKMGVIIGAVMKKAAGQADGKRVQASVASHLN